VRPDAITTPSSCCVSFAAFSTRKSEGEFWSALSIRFRAAMIMQLTSGHSHEWERRRPAEQVARSQAS
jgi:hypothetical protein